MPSEDIPDFLSNNSHRDYSLTWVWERAPGGNPTFKVISRTQTVRSRRMGHGGRGFLPNFRRP